MNPEDYPRQLEGTHLDSDKFKDIVSIRIFKTPLFYDVVATGRVDDLEKIKEIYKSESEIIEDSIFEDNLIVLETVSELEEAREVIEDIRINIER